MAIDGTMLPGMSLKQASNSQLVCSNKMLICSTFLNGKQCVITRTGNLNVVASHGDPYFSQIFQQRRHHLSDPLLLVVGHLLQLLEFRVNGCQGALVVDHNMNKYAVDIVGDHVYSVIILKVPISHSALHWEPRTLWPCPPLPGFSGHSWRPVPPGPEAPPSPPPWRLHSLPAAGSAPFAACRDRGGRMIRAREWR